MARQSLHKTTSISFESAKQLRKDATAAETVLWELLRNRRMLGLKFRRQEPLYGYIADFYCHKLQLIIEVDGGYHNSLEQQTADEERSQYLNNKGLTVFRLTNNEACNPQLAIETIQQFIKSASLPLLAGEGRGEVYA